MDWSQEKIYRVKRAEELKEAMEEAIQDNNKKQFTELYKTASHYMKRTDRAKLMRKFIQHI